MTHESAGMADPRRWIALTVVSLATFMVLLDLTVINVALPEIRNDLHTPYEGILWVLDAYSIMLASLLLPAGAAADRFGPKVILTIGLVGFTCASLSCGLAANSSMLYLSRGVQGAFAAILYAVGPQIIVRVFPAGQRATAFAVFGASSGIAIAAGPLIGGYLTNIDWRWVFFLNVPVGVVALALCMYSVARSKSSEDLRGFDWTGTALSVIGLLFLCGSIIRSNTNGWLSAQTIGGMIIGAIALVAFIRYELACKQPILDVRLFASRSFASLSAATFCFNFSVNAVILYAALWMQGVLGYNTINTGFRFSPLTGVLFVAGAIGGALTARFTTRILMCAALILAGVGFLLLLTTHADSSWTTSLVGFVIAGAGMGMHNPPRANGAVEMFPESLSGMASGANETFQQAGVAFGIAILGSIAGTVSRNTLTGSQPRAGGELKTLATTGSVRGHGLPTDLMHTLGTAFMSGAHSVYLIGGVLTLVGALVALVGIERDPVHTDHRTSEAGSVSQVPAAEVAR